MESVYRDESLCSVPLWHSSLSNTCIIVDLACQAAQTVMTVHITVWLFFFLMTAVETGWPITCTTVFFSNSLCDVSHDGHGCDTIDGFGNKTWIFTKAEGTPLKPLFLALHCCSSELLNYRAIIPIFRFSDIVISHFNLQLYQWKQLENLYFREKKFAVEVNDPHRWAAGGILLCNS